MYFMHCKKITKISYKIGIHAIKPENFEIKDTTIRAIWSSCEKKAKAQKYFP
jgi:hypothetical protein